MRNLRPETVVLPHYIDAIAKQEGDGPDWEGLPHCRLVTKLLAKGPMLGDLNNADLLKPPPLLSVDELDRQRLLDDWYGQLAQIAAQIAGHRAELKGYQQKIERVLRQARHPSVSPAMLYEHAAKMAQSETNAAKETQRSLEQLIAVADQSARTATTDPDDKINRAILRYAEEGIDIGVSWLELAQNFRLECLRLASEKGEARPIISSADELERELASLREDAT